MMLLRTIVFSIALCSINACNLTVSPPLSEAEIRLSPSDGEKNISLIVSHPPIINNEDFGLQVKFGDSMQRENVNTTEPDFTCNAAWMKRLNNTSITLQIRVCSSSTDCTVDDVSIFVTNGNTMCSSPKVPIVTVINECATTSQTETPSSTTTSTSTATATTTTTTTTNGPNTATATQSPSIATSNQILTKVVSPVVGVGVSVGIIVLVAPIIVVVYKRWRHQGQADLEAAPPSESPSTS